MAETVEYCKSETVEEYLPEEYEMLVNEVANNLESSSGDEYDSEDEEEDLSPSTYSYESFDSGDEDSEDLYDSEDSEDEDSEDEDSEDMGDFVAKKDNNKKVRRSSVLSFLCQLLCCCDSRL